MLTQDYINWVVNNKITLMKDTINQVLNNWTLHGDLISKWSLNLSDQSITHSVVYSAKSFGRNARTLSGLSVICWMYSTNDFWTFTSIWVILSIKCSLFSHWKKFHKNSVKFQQLHCRPPSTKCDLWVRKMMHIYTCKHTGQ